MSPREPGRDEQGRPIVAELGRAETPQETADRKAAASAKRRTNQTAVNLGIATVVSLLAAIAIVFTVGLVGGESRIQPVDYRAETANAQSSFDGTLVVPELPQGWWANRVLIDRTADVASWRIGFVTPDEQYVALIQTLEANPSWLDGQVKGASPGATVSLGGVDWTIYDRRDADDPGNVAYALVTESGASTIVLAGTADDAEFEELARAVAEELP
ncbi:DUF4245 domain-containing protein [Protaetiibacter intestinalis]|uniref:DUF4245 domain-containing protein n=1 Tax=Protaetiibacter intestinalis TaxID=2419774 RepID=UPI0013007E25|nr:DUF4245 domain-containing protein [Protaetiibacter intestinalis]